MQYARTSLVTLQEELSAQAASTFPAAKGSNLWFLTPPGKKNVRGPGNCQCAPFTSLNPGACLRSGYRRSEEDGSWTGMRERVCVIEVRTRIHEYLRMTLLPGACRQVRVRLNWQPQGNI